MTRLDVSPTAAFLDFIERGELRVAYDSARKRTINYNELDGANQKELEWVAARGTGTVVAGAVYPRRYSDRFDPPYNIAMVRLDEGPVLLTSVLGVVGAPPVGMSVRACIGEDGRLVFVPTKETEN